jgi:TolA-binding protein
VSDRTGPGAGTGAGTEKGKGEGEGENVQSGRAVELAAGEPRLRKLAGELARVLTEKKKTAAQVQEIVKAQEDERKELQELKEALKEALRKPRRGREEKASCNKEKIMHLQMCESWC